jgi:hypothetical protein
MKDAGKWFVRNQQNPHLALATNGEWEPLMFLGPGQDLGVKLYKTRAGAARAKNGRGIPEELTPA